ncbi:MAG: branched-chain amino acid ABC transporter permease [Candidatus Tectomicrobia bacterium]|nr:branched-chain amino acid ABC transporter permease [Candidatus Tectomicrobia bacterium]
MGRTFHSSYAEEMALFQSDWARAWMAIFLALLLGVPALLGPYLLSVLNLAGVAVIGAIGLNLLIGTTGQISLGHVAFIACGGYTTAILAERFGLPFWLLIPASGCVAALIGLVVGVPSLRLEGFYLAMATLAAAFIIEYVYAHWESLTAGTTGMKVARPTLAGAPLESSLAFFYFQLPWVIGATLFAKNLTRTKVGRAWVAIRDRDISAETLGIDLTHYKLVAFIVSAFYGGVAGSLYVYYLKTVSPEHFTFALMIEYIAMLIVGGVGSILGSIFGAVFITLLPEALRLVTDLLRDDYPVLSFRFLYVKQGIYGLIIILFLLFKPDGCFGWWQDVKRYWQTWPYKHS